MYHDEISFERATKSKFGKVYEIMFFCIETQVKIKVGFRVFRFYQIRGVSKCFSTYKIFDL